jgi:hypothetical protein
MPTMSSRVKRYLMAGAVLCGLAPCSFAGPSTTTLTVTQSGLGDNYIIDDGLASYIGPYQVNIDDSVNTTAAICIDYQNDPPYPADLNPGTTWTVSAPAGQTLLEQAYLADQLLTSPSPFSGLQSAEIQYAIWQLGDSTATGTLVGPIQDYLLPANVPNGPAVALGSLGPVTGTNFGDATFLGQVTYWENQALYNVENGYNGSDVSVYATLPGEVDTNGVALQRFITAGGVTTTSVAEPPSLSLLGFDFSAVGGLIFLLRRRITA